ncbi:MAG: 7-cyano-7-deazaguanine synthase QueC [Candidatus Marinimicrobia bacterium]|nr:7-cyano-7-deazaguanine synthase QueC [Candidatus Neomarinimicrobiota bacterium]MDP7094731.1 7-cyano-7-deazaguanine synthase QueC [Candidatus Neomarinimicrobiota bacterium]MDP7166025.1 7-cyano-7-deazaguanine synthase QueC [Candidatus Neomarinimicrobiota bacterium]HJM12458.1 7-cyano-7-deazaguanine synthase QueC [Candidatus Neomarinimicrobiota bacterium]
MLLSGGLDSTTCLAIAKEQGFIPYALSFDYGQRNNYELESAKKLVNAFQVLDHKVIQIDLRAFGGSALTDTIDVPKDTEFESNKIPITYVPARNTIFLSFALAWAETLNAYDIFIGVNALDYSGYPDCRPEYIKSFQNMANLATKTGVENELQLTIHTPLINLTKAEIIQKGIALGIDYSLTHSCYDPSAKGQPCGHCDSCQLRLNGFLETGYKDPLKYQD